jgi:hypothetical protein
MQALYSHLTFSCHTIIKTQLKINASKIQVCHEFPLYLPDHLHFSQTLFQAKIAFDSSIMSSCRPTERPLAARVPRYAANFDKAERASSENAGSTVEVPLRTNTSSTIFHEKESLSRSSIAGIFLSPKEFIENSSSIVKCRRERRFLSET